MTAGPSCTSVASQSQRGWRVAPLSILPVDPVLLSTGHWETQPSNLQHVFGELHRAATMNFMPRLRNTLAMICSLPTMGCDGSSTSDLSFEEDGDEPRYVSGASRSVFFESFDAYCDAESFTSGGGWEMDGPLTQLTAPANSGEDGGRAAEFLWHVGDGWLILSKDLSSKPLGRVSYMSWDYRAPNFSYGGTHTAQLEKKHMIINLGQNTRITVEMHGYSGEEALVVAMLQTVGPYLFENPTKMPWGDQHATIEHLTDGAWHHFTVRRTAESANGALDGAIELWLDGQKLFNLQKIGTSTDNLMNLAIAGTINGGSSIEQHEYYDNIRVWY